MSHPEHTEHRIAGQDLQSRRGRGSESARGPADKRFALPGCCDAIGPTPELVVVPACFVSYSFRLWHKTSWLCTLPRSFAALATRDRCGNVRSSTITWINTYAADERSSNRCGNHRRLGKADKSDFSPEAAREILSLQLSPKDQKRMQKLSLKAQEGALTPREQSEVESYRRVGYWLAVLWSKARLSLKHAGMEGKQRMKTARERSVRRRAKTARTRPDPKPSASAYWSEP
jgi:hypothetical protein